MSSSFHLIDTPGPLIRRLSGSAWMVSRLTDGRIELRRAFACPAFAPRKLAIEFTSRMR